LRALVALRRHREQFPAEALLGPIRANWDHRDRYVRKAAADLIAGLDRAAQQALAGHIRPPRAEATFGLGTVHADPKDTLKRAGRLLAKDVEPETRLAAVRLVQLALGGLVSPKSRGTVWEGYTPRKNLAAGDGLWPLPLEVDNALLRAFPSGHADLDRELSRTLAVLEHFAPRTFAEAARRLTSDSDPVEDLHYLAVLARLKVRRWPAVTKEIAGALLALDHKLEKRRLNRDRHWPLRVAELHAGLAARDPDLNAALLAHPEFGRPDHALFATAKGFDRRKAAEVFLARAARDRDYPWNAALVELVGELPEERALPALRRLWGKAGLEAALLPALARRPQAADRAKFVQGLASPQAETVQLCLDALNRLPGSADAAETMTLIQALGRLPEGKPAALRDTLAARLAKVTGQGNLGADRAAWRAWFTRAHPDLAERLSNPDGVDVPGWEKRLARVDWARGDPVRGQAVFVKASCAACHSGSQALGPDLAGVAGRFSRADLFTALLQPSRDVSPRYQTTVIETAEGKIYQGLVIYEAVDGVLLQTGAASTVRVAGEQIAARRVTSSSLMPAGLLEGLRDEELADLYTYLRTLGATPGTR
jgi:putative heme-binding domain-containing protein